MNIDEEQRLLQVETHLAILADQAEEDPKLDSTVIAIADDFTWLKDRVRYYEKICATYNEEVRILLNGTHAE